jgi:predicted TIM-barrel fold metal-dependent hydrolase
MLALRTIVPTSQIVYGTDYPYRDFAWTSMMLNDDKVFSAAEMAGINRDNAAKLMAASGKPVPA